MVWRVALNDGKVGQHDIPGTEGGRHVPCRIPKGNRLLRYRGNRRYTLAGYRDPLDVSVDRRASR